MTTNVIDAIEFDPKLFLREEEARIMEEEGLSREDAEASCLLIVDGTLASSEEHWARFYQDDLTVEEIVEGYKAAKACAKEFLVTLKTIKASGYRD